MYSLSDYLWMVAEDERVGAYAGAIRALLRPGDRVLEVGAGFGFFSVIAAATGAAHVDAVETNPAIHLGPKVAAANGCADRVDFHHCDVRQLTLAAPVDLLISDLRGPTPFGRRALEVLIDARIRLLRPGGLMIPASDRVIVAPARTPAVYRGDVHGAHDQHGVDLSPVEQIIFDTPARCAVAADDLVGEGRHWVTIDYASIDHTDASATVAWEFDHGIQVDGLAVWFETDLGGGFGFSTRPGANVTTYRHMFVPFRAPVTFAAEETFRVELSVRQVRENNVWAWRGWRSRPGQADTLVVDQNSLAEIVVDPAALPDTSTEARPVLGARGKALVELMTRMDGTQSVAALASHLAQQSPHLFRSVAAAEEFAAAWVHRAGQLERGED